MIVINSSLVIGVMLKTIINKNVIENHISSDIRSILIFEIIMFAIFSFLYLLLLFIFIYFYNEKKWNNDEDKDKKGYTSLYVGGYFLIKTKYISSFITIKGFCSYISSVLTNWRILLVFFINFCSRIQKVKFKNEYKKK